MSDFEDILVNGISFGRGGTPKKEDDKVRTKAKKKKYITGAHGSGSARQKAKYREQRANVTFCYNLLSLFNTVEGSILRPLGQ